MPLKSAIYLLIHLLLAGWTGSLISGYSLGVRQEGQDSSSNDVFGGSGMPIGPGVESRERRNAESNSVRVPPRSLYLRDTPPKTATLPENSKYVLECKAGGNPMPIITWLKDGIQIEQGDALASNGITDTDAIPSGVGSTMSRLYLDCLSPRDMGLYTCVASSPYQRATSDTSVFVTRSLTSEVSPYCPILSSGFVPQAPRIYLHTTRVLQVIGTDVLLLCRSFGESSTVTKWTRNDDEMIPSNARTSVLKNGDLLIRDLKWLDMGLYKCEVSNSQGRDSVTTFLYPMRNGK